MTRVEPHRYADTPIFRGMLYERDGRFPGTPEGEEGDVVSYEPEPVPDATSGAVMVRVVPLGDKVLIPVPMPDDETQPVPIISLKKA